LETSEKQTRQACLSDKNGKDVGMKSEDTEVIERLKS
jgi:hypothetical protein